jgi:environmental stress-induced protein Ves
LFTNFPGNERAQALLAGWGLTLDPNTVDLMARVLNPQAIIFGGNVSHQGSEQADWGAAATRNKVLQAVSFTTVLAYSQFCQVFSYVISFMPESS